MANDEFLLNLLQAMADRAGEPLYPARFALERNLDRDDLDRGLDELRRRGLVRFTDWVKDRGQGYKLTEAGREALSTRNLKRAPEPQTPDAPEIHGSFERAETARRAIFQPRRAVATRLLLLANILYFAFGAIIASEKGGLGEYLEGRGVTTNQVLIQLGAVHPILVFPDQIDPGARPQYERLVLFFFLHIGLLHLFMNMYFLGSLGPLVEAMWGWPRYLAIYFTAGIVSGCAILLIDGFMHLTPEQTALTAGASGSLYGVFVAMVVWFSFNYEYLPAGLIQDWQRSTFINVIILVAINFIPGLSWQGHFGGAVGGFLAALLLHVQRHHRSRVIRVLALAGVPAISVLFFVAVLWQAGRL